MLGTLFWEEPAAQEYTHQNPGSTCFRSWAGHVSSEYQVRMTRLGTLLRIRMVVHDTTPPLCQQTWIPTSAKTSSGSGCSRVSQTCETATIGMPKMFSDLCQRTERTQGHNATPPRGSSYLTIKASGPKKHNIVIQFFRPDSSIMGPSGYVKAGGCSHNSNGARPFNKFKACPRRQTAQHS